VTKATRALFIALLVAASSVMIHVAVITRDSFAEWAALTMLVAIPLADQLFSLHVRAWLTLGAAALALSWLSFVSGAEVILYVPSVVIPALLAWFFGRTLVADRTPLVEQIAKAARDVVPDRLVRYSRNLTQMWTLVFVTMSATALLLALSGRRELWSIVTNFGNYAFVGAVVLAEYAYRRWRFRDYPHPGLVEYLRIVVHANPRRLS
jgi:uncharacterized membrane protein